MGFKDDFQVIYNECEAMLWESGNTAEETRKLIPGLMHARVMYGQTYIMAEFVETLKQLMLMQARDTSGGYS